jgi:hypothetical protein
MSTRQRLTHETAAPPLTGASLVLARGVDGGVSHGEDIAARRLRELSQRLSATEKVALAADDDSKLEKSDAQFEPVSLAAILALGRQQTPDTPDDQIVESAADARPLVAIPAPTEAPSPEPASADNHIEPASLPVPFVGPKPAEPLRLSGEVLLEHDETPPSEPSEQVSFAPTADNDAAPDDNPPLLLADQSETDIRLVDLIRRQQSLLDQLNSFPPSYQPPPDEVAEAAPAAPAETPRSVIELLAPPPATAPPEVREVREAREREVREEAPPPFPPRKDTRTHREPPRLATPAARERTDEPAAADLPQQSPMIIQRARAERSVRRGPVVAAPPSAVPAFLAGLAVALVVAGVLFAIL